MEIETPLIKVKPVKSQENRQEIKKFLEGIKEKEDELKDYMTSEDDPI